jgi:hypothetical protein
MNYCIARLLLLAPLLALSCLAAGQESLVLSLKTHVPSPLALSALNTHVRRCAKTIYLQLVLPGGGIADLTKCRPLSGIDSAAAERLSEWPRARYPSIGGSGGYRRAFGRCFFATIAPLHSKCNVVIALPGRSQRGGNKNEYRDADLAISYGLPALLQGITKRTPVICDYSRTHEWQETAVAFGMLL